MLLVRKSIGVRVTTGRKLVSVYSPSSRSNRGPLYEHASSVSAISGDISRTPTSQPVLFLLLVSQEG